ncbi:MAG: hypothetical protein R2736_01080 [Solirubrobacterales bacterium]
MTASASWLRVLVEQQVALVHVGERRGEAAAVAAPVGHDRDLRTQPQPDRGEVVVGGVEDHVAEAVGEQHVDGEPVRPRLRGGQHERLELLDRAGLAGAGQRLPARQRRRHRREDVAPVERGRHRLQPPRRARDVDRFDDPAEALRGQHQQPVVGPDERALLLRAGERDGAPRPADPRIDHRQMHAGRHVRQCVAQHQRPVAHVVARHPMGDVDDRGGRRQPGQDAVADADELVLLTVVAQERDEHAREG